MSQSLPKDQVGVVTLVRGEEKYVFVFHPERRTELLRLLGRYAADPTLSFNWYDAAVLSQRIREMMPASSSGAIDYKAGALNSIIEDDASEGGEFEPDEFGSSPYDSVPSRNAPSRFRFPS
jgi:hypothetical protein